MSNNVYIGMRYVPVFDGDWDNTKSYEALTIVQYGNNTYTSKQPVPAGTLPTNTTYWALTGNYNGQISNIMNLIGNTQLDTSDQTLTGAINEVRETALTKKYIFIGDSYGVGTNAGTQYGWLVQVKNIMGLTEGTDVWSYGQGGYGFTGNVGTFLQLLNQAISDITRKDEITDIFVAGGFNDIGDSGLETAIATFVSTANTNFPNAKITIAFNAAYDNNHLATPINGQSFNLTKLSYTKGSGNVRVVPDLYSILFSEYGLLQTDGIHPTITGYEKLAVATAQVIRGSDPDHNWPLTQLQFTPASDVGWYTTTSMYWRRTRDGVAFWIQPFYFNPTLGSGAGNTNTELVLGHFTNMCLKPLFGSSYFRLPISANIQTTTGIKANCSGWLCLAEDGEVRIWLPSFVPNSTTRYNWSQINTIEMTTQYFFIPIDALVN